MNFRRENLCSHVHISSTILKTQGKQFVEKNLRSFLCSFKMVRKIPSKKSFFKLCFVQVAIWGRGSVVVSALDFRSEGRWFDAQSLPSRCFLRQETLLHIVSLHPGV